MSRADGKPRRGGKKKRIGVRELVSIPEWGLSEIQAKVDTGAYTSSIDASRVVIFFQGGEGRSAYAEITFGTGEEAHTVVAPVIGFRRVRNPSGHVTNRPIVEARLVLGGKRFRTAINLHRRVGMRCRMIIGRRALAGRFVVDVSRRGKASRA